MNHATGPAAAVLLRSAAAAIAGGLHVAYAIRDAAGVHVFPPDDARREAASAEADRLLELIARAWGANGDRIGDAEAAAARFAARMPHPAEALHALANGIPAEFVPALAEAARRLDSGGYLTLAIDAAAGVHDAPGGSELDAARAKAHAAARTLCEQWGLPGGDASEIADGIRSHADGNPMTAINLLAAAARIDVRTRGGPDAVEELTGFAMSWRDDAEDLLEAMRNLLHLTIAGAADERLAPSPDEFEGARRAAVEAWERAQFRYFAGLLDTLTEFDPFE